MLSTEGHGRGVVQQVLCRWTNSKNDSAEKLRCAVPVPVSLFCVSQELSKTFASFLVTVSSFSCFRVASVSIDG